MTGSRVVLVTGASSGIGRATAESLLRRGDQVAVLSRDGGRLHDVMSGYAEQALMFPADVADADSVAAAVAAVLDRFGRLDAVVHAAQSMAYGRIEDVPAEVFDRVVDVAMNGTANLARIVLPYFRRQRRGTLVIVNSLLGQIATPRMGTYDAAKWGQFGLARVLQLETRDVPDVHVCMVSPGAINTPIYDQAANYAGRAGHPPAPVVAPDRVAAAALRLLDHPRRLVEVGPANHLIKLGFRFLPTVFDRIVGPLVNHIVFRGDPVADDTGNVLQPRPEAEQVLGGWTVLGMRRTAGVAVGVDRLSPRRAAALRRRRLTVSEFSAGAVGASGAGAATDERSAVVGHGASEFERAADALRHWGIHTGAGQRVAAEHDRITAGDAVVLRQRGTPVPAPCRVMSTIDEPRTVGYTIATLWGHPERGVESFVIERGDDDVVRLIVTVAAEPAFGLGVVRPVLDAVRRRILDRYAEALLPATTPAVDARNTARVLHRTRTP